MLTLCGFLPYRFYSAVGSHFFVDRYHTQLYRCFTLRELADDRVIRTVLIILANTQRFFLGFVSLTCRLSISFPT